MLNGYILFFFSFFFFCLPFLSKYFRECHKLITMVFLLNLNDNTKNCEAGVEIQIFQTMFSSKPKPNHQIQIQVGD